MTGRPLLSRSAGQRGQALTEFLVVSVCFLLPLFMLIPVLGKYLDMKAAVVQGARYVAWERTVFYGGSEGSADWPGVQKTDAEIRNELRQRVFSQNTRIQNNDKTDNNWPDSGYRNSWRNRDGSGMLKNYDAVVQSADRPEWEAIADKALKLVVTITDALGPFDLEMKGLYTANVSMTANTLPIAFGWDGKSSSDFNPGALTFTDRNAIVVNTWSAQGSLHTYKQTQGLTPTGIFGTLEGKVILGILQAVISVAMPEVWFLELGKIEPDVVPEDRLVDKTQKDYQ